MADTAASDVSEGPVLNVINKRLRALRKKYNRIVQMEESISKGKTLNKEQEETLRSKPAVIAGIDELEKLREPLASAVVEEVNLAVQQHQVSPSDSLFTTSADSNSEDSEKQLRKLDGDSDRKSENERLMLVEDLLTLLYFGWMFDVKSLQSDFTATMLKRTHERACCLSYDCMPEDESSDVIDLLGERDLDLISMVSGLLISRPVNSPLSHKHALQQCIEHAKLWITKSDQPIVPDSNATYAELSSKLNRIMSSLYFTTDPVKVETAAANYGSYSVPIEESVGVVHVNESQQVHTIAVQSQQKEEEHASSQGNDTNEIQASSLEEIQQGEQRENLSELAAEAEEVTPWVEGDDNLKDVNFREQQSGPRRSYQNQNYRGNRNGGGRGGHRGYSDGRVGRGRGGSYQNGRNHYYDQSSNYYQKSYYNNYRGRGGRGGTVGGNYKPHASDGQAGNISVDS